MPLPIILIDDHPSYCEKLRQEASEYNLEISSFHNLEDGINALHSNRHFKAVILDGRCLLHKKQTGMPKSNFVFHAIQDIEEIQDMKKREIPYCVCSETPGDFTEDLEGIALVFDKNNSSDEMFEYLLSRIKILPELIIREQYPEVFSFADAYFSDNDIEILENTLINQNAANHSNIVQNIASVRRLEEAFYDTMCINYYGKSPEHFAEKNANRTKAIFYRFFMDKLMPDFILNFSKNIYSLSSRYGSHAYNNKKSWFNPQTYMVSSLIHNLFALYQWGNQLLETLNQKKINS